MPVKIGSTPMHTLKTLAASILLAGLARGGDRFHRYLLIPSNEGLFGSPPVGDVDADGYDDLLLAWQPANWPTGPVHIRVRSGLNGTLFYDWPPTPPATVNPTTGAGAGDLNLDGHADIVLGTQVGIPNASGTGQVEFRSGADGSFLGILTVPSLGWGPFGIVGSSLGAPGDLNGDGFPEVMIGGGPLGQCLGVLVLSGASLTTLYTYSPVCGVYYGSSLARVDDFDGDGFPEFLIGAPSWPPGGRLEFYSGATGAQLTTMSGTALGQGVGSWAFGLGDVDADGITEVASLEYFLGPGGVSQSQVVVRSVGSWTPAYTVTYPNLCCGVDRLLDASGDGIDEIVAYTIGGGRQLVFSGSDGSVLFDLSSPSTPAYPTGVSGVPLGDVNGDGLGDIGVRTGTSSNFVLPPWAAQDLTWGWTWPPGPPGSAEVWVYAARNFEVVGPTLVGGSAQFDLLVPKRPGRPFQVVFSLEGQIPGIPLGPFMVPLLPDSLFLQTAAMGIGGVLDATGRATLTLPIPANPSLRNYEIKASGVVYDPAGPLGIGCVLTGESFRIQ